jgi:hypothetical protein
MASKSPTPEMLPYDPAELYAHAQRSYEFDYSLAGLRPRLIEAAFGIRIRQARSTARII